MFLQRQDEERSSQLLVKHSRRMRKLQNHSEKWLQFQVIGQMASRLVGGITHKPTPSLEPGGERLTVSGKSLDQPSHVSQGASSQGIYPMVLDCVFTNLSEPPDVRASSVIQAIVCS